MNATQSKALIEAARNAMALLPRSDERLALARALNALAATPGKAKSAKISKKARPYKPIIGAPTHKTIWKPIYSWSLKDYDVPRYEIEADSSCRCAGCQILAGFRARGFQAPVTIERNAKTDAYLQSMDDRAALSKFCACDHLADEHEKDELENLLKCTRCGCDHFRIDVDQQEQDAA